MLVPAVRSVENWRETLKKIADRAKQDLYFRGALRNQMKYQTSAVHFVRGACYLRFDSAWHFFSRCAKSGTDISVFAMLPPGAIWSGSLCSPGKSTIAYA
eukprot:2371694-Rhodomonas_salina.5